MRGKKITGWWRQDSRNKCLRCGAARATQWTFSTLLSSAADVRAHSVYEVVCGCHGLSTERRRHKIALVDLAVMHECGSGGESSASRVR